jgi:hypothetical protein
MAACLVSVINQKAPVAAGRYNDVLLLCHESSWVVIALKNRCHLECHPFSTSHHVCNDAINAHACCLPGGFFG